MAYDNLKLDKGLYTCQKGFNAALEAIDPSDNYIGTNMEGLDAYQRQLKRFDIKVSGTNSDTVSKFFSTSDSAALFPEYISRAVRQGIDDTNIVDKLIASKTNIDSLDYRAIESVSADENDYIGAINEGTFIPETRIKTKDTLTSLHKRGRMLTASYEAIKSQKLDVFTVALKQIGEYISACQLVDFLNVLSAQGSIHTISYTDSSKGVQYKDIVNLWNELAPYNMTTILADTDSIGKLLNIEEFKDSTAGLTFHGTGNPITPMGADVVRVPKKIGEIGIIGLDKNYAMEMVQFGDVVTDFDKLIDRQLERASITATAGFSPIFRDAALMLQ